MKGFRWLSSLFSNFARDDGTKDKILWDKDLLSKIVEHIDSQVNSDGFDKTIAAWAFLRDAVALSPVPQDDISGKNVICLALNQMIADMNLQKSNEIIAFEKRDIQALKSHFAYLYETSSAYQRSLPTAGNVIPFPGAFMTAAEPYNTNPLYVETAKKSIQAIDGFIARLLEPIRSIPYPPTYAEKEENWPDRFFPQD